MELCVASFTTKLYPLYQSVWLFFLVTLDDSRAGGSTDSGISGGSAGVSVMTGGGLE